MATTLKKRSLPPCPFCHDDARVSAFFYLPTALSYYGTRPELVGQFICAGCDVVFGAVLSTLQTEA